MAESTFNTRLRNLGVRPGSYWVSPRAVSWVWGCRPPSLVVLSSVSHRLFQEPCTLGGHLARSFPPVLHPSPPIFKPFFHLYFPHKANKTKQKKRYTAAGPPPCPCSSTLSPPCLLYLLSSLFCPHHHFSLAIFALLHSLIPLPPQISVHIHLPSPLITKEIQLRLLVPLSLLSLLFISALLSSFSFPPVSPHFPLLSFALVFCPPIPFIHYSLFSFFFFFFFCFFFFFY
jgi:hypothetical protein